MVLFALVCSAVALPMSYTQGKKSTAKKVLSEFPTDNPQTTISPSAQSTNLPLTDKELIPKLYE